MKKISTKSGTNYSWSFFIDYEYPYCYQENFLSNDECQTIIDSYSEKLETAYLAGKEGNRIDVSYRDSSTHFISPNLDNVWLYRRLTDSILSLNRTYYNFDVTGFQEGLQFTEYKEPGQKYSQHIDTLLGGVIRKLSISVQLTDPKEYEGGDLIMIPGEKIPCTEKKRGTLIMFPSFQLHEVTPVTQGTRHSLVGWVSGPRFK